MSKRAKLRLETKFDHAKMEPILNPEMPEAPNFGVDKTLKLK